MKKLMIAAIAASGLAASPALAAPSADYVFTGTVAAICTIAGGTDTFGALTNGSGTYANPGSKTITDPSAYCNQGLTKVTIKRTNLVGDKAASSGFTNVVPLAASLTATNGGTPVTVSDGSSLATTATGQSAGSAQTTIGAFTGLTVTATPGTPSATLVAGTYTGTITVELFPAS